MYAALSVPRLVTVGVLLLALPAAAHSSGWRGWCSSLVS